MACYKRERVPLDLDYIYQDKCEDMRGKFLGKNVIQNIECE